MINFNVLLCKPFFLTGYTNLPDDVPCVTILFTYQYYNIHLYLVHIDVKLKHNYLNFRKR